MTNTSKIILIGCLFSIKIIASACETGSDDYSSSSGSSGSGGGSSGYTLRPLTHNTSYSSNSDIQCSANCQAADVRYDQYTECMALYDGSPDCDGYYTPNYTETAALCMQTYSTLGCS